jgi:membrane associated rhomboid family serine protease
MLASWPILLSRCHLPSFHSQPASEMPDNRSAVQAPPRIPQTAPSTHAFAWSDALGIALTLIWLCQVPTEGALPRYVTPAQAVFGLNDQSWHPWQLVTYSLVHSHGFHIFGNLFALALGSKAVEASTIRGILPLVFFISALIGGVLQVLCGPLYYHFDGSVGASGGIYAILVLALTKSLKHGSNVLLRYRIWAVLGVLLTLETDVTGYLQHHYFAQLHLGGTL